MIEFIESRTEMEQILREETLGFLGVARDGEPYVVPLNYAYMDGRILFHCALAGKKLEYLGANPQVCFTVGRQSGEVKAHGEGDSCHPDYDSVICFGTARTITDIDERTRLLNDFNRQYDPNAKGITRDRAEKCGAVEIRVSEMTGRRERDKKSTYWRHCFES
ncbi:pyridoxamine 5'-phosphate oxidase family protein [Candidatus Latescibacterota bacterium]